MYFEKTITKRSKEYDFDMLIRAKSKRGKVKLLISKTDDFRSRLNNDIKILANVIKSQKQLIEYNALYNAYVLDHISEDDFIEESENYTYTPKDINPNKLADKLACLLKSTGIEFASSDLAEIFQCKQENIIKALEYLPNNLSALIE